MVMSVANYGSPAQPVARCFSTMKDPEVNAHMRLSLIVKRRACWYCDESPKWILAYPTRSSHDVVHAWLAVDLQLPISLPQEELDCTEVLLVQCLMPLELFPRKGLEIRSGIWRLGSSGPQAIAVEREDISLEA